MGNTHEIQNGRNPVRDWFLPIATKVKPDIAKGQTAQGRYVFAADGTAYGFNNNRSVERVHQLMDKSLTMFRANPPAKVGVSKEELLAKFVPESPAGTAVVRLFTRIRPAPLGSDSSNENVARDHLWILPAEAAELSKGNISDSLKLRILRFALVDNVRGEPDHWRVQEIKRADFKAEKKPGQLEIRCNFRMETGDSKRGFEGALEAAADFDSAGQMTKFLAYAEGQAWGRSTYTPNEPKGRSPLAVGFRLVEDETAKAVAPQAVFHGREYLTGR